MDNSKSPIFYAEMACKTMMRKYKAAELPPKGHFHYHQGVFLSGVYQIYLLNHNETYFQYIKEWIDSMIDEKGNVHGMECGKLDDIQPGILLYPLLERTNEQRYKKALDTLLSLIKDFPRTEEGGFWHNEFLNDQMWLDGLYMAGPISAEYAAKFQCPEYLELVILQILLMFEKTKDNKTGLLYHAWDGSKTAKWADSETGLSPEFWGRSIGWVPLAVLNVLDFIPEEHLHYQNICNLLVELLKAVCNFQSEEGRWYQVVNKGMEKGNWLENSCSCLFTVALCKAVRKGILEKCYLEQAGKGYEGVIRSLDFHGEELELGAICIGTGVGDYEHYCERPVCVNDLHGMGAFLLMCGEMQTALHGK